MQSNLKLKEYLLSFFFGKKKNNGFVTMEGPEGERRGESGLGQI
jgi:hypothetical protein